MLTASIGVAHFLLDGNDAEQLLAEADRRMYKEKRTRRNLPTSVEVERKTQWATTVH